MGALVPSKHRRSMFIECSHWNQTPWCMGYDVPEGGPDQSRETTIRLNIAKAFSMGVHNERR